MSGIIYLKELTDRLLPLLIQRLAATPRIVGPEDRLHVAGDAKQLCDALLNTVGGEIRIGEDVFFGHGVMVLTGTHDPFRVRRDRIENYPTTGHDVIIGRGVWVASGAILLGPCVIGTDAVIAAGAVVTGDVPARTIVAGNPARFVRLINDQ